MSISETSLFAMAGDIAMLHKKGVVAGLNEGKRQGDIENKRLRGIIKDLEKKIQEVCHHEGDSKNGVCFICGGEI